MFRTKSATETEDIQLLQQLNHCLQKQTLPNPTPNQQARPYLRQINNFTNTSSISTSKQKPFLLKPQSFSIQDPISLDQSTVSSKWDTKIDHFYSLIEKLIVVDQEIVYLKNLLHRFGDKKKCQCPHLQEQLKRFSVWQYLPSLSPLPSQQQVQLSEKKLVKSVDDGKRIFNSIISQFSKKEAEGIFRDLDIEAKGSIDIYDLIGRLQERIGRTYDVNDVINLFERLTGKEQLTMKEFTMLFAK